MNVNSEIVLKIFLGFKEIFSNITNEIMENELLNFEQESIQIIKKLNEIYYRDFNIELDFTNKNNLKEIIKDLKHSQKIIANLF